MQAIKRLAFGCLKIFNTIIIRLKFLKKLFKYFDMYFFV